MAKGEQVLWGSIVVFLLFVGWSYLRMDIAMIKGDAAYEKAYKEKTITYKKPNGKLAKMRVLTFENSYKRRPIPSDLVFAEEDEQPEGANETPMSQELIGESIKQFLESELQNEELKNKEAWLSQRWKGAGKQIGGLENSTKELLRKVLLELHELQLRRDSKDFSDDSDENSDLSTGIEVRDEESADRGEFKFREYGHIHLRRLVVFSSYRSSMREFTMVTLSPSFMQAADGPFFNVCTWLPDGSTTSPGHFSSLDAINSTGRSPNHSGTLNLRYIEDTHGRTFDTLIIRCLFADNVGADGTGGFLYLNISHGPITHGPKSSENSENIPVFHERPKQLNASQFTAETFEVEYAYCSAPVWTPLNSLHVKEWFMYHHPLLEGKVHYYIYDNIGIDEKTLGVMQPFIDAGLLTVINMQRERLYDTWYHTQALAINDCLNRVRFSAKWAIFWDFDEYLHLPAPLTLPTLLQRVETEGAPWISFANMWYSRAYCTRELEAKEEWAVERMLWRLEKPICGKSDVSHECEGEMGHRKWIANPRQVKVGSIHRALEPQWIGITLHSNIARVNHYSGLAGPESAKVDCSLARGNASEADGTVLDNWWYKDAALAAFAGSIKTAAQTYEVFRSPVNEG